VDAPAAARDPGWRPAEGKATTAPAGQEDPRRRFGPQRRAEAQGDPAQEGAAMSAVGRVTGLDWTPLRVMRHRTDVTQARVGAMCLPPVTASLVSKWERGSRAVSALQAVQVSQGMGTPWYDLCLTITEKP
jgi:DNA-binding transcriptional regulator YiaG